jgi:hypothetical protein
LMMIPAFQMIIGQRAPVSPAASPPMLFRRGASPLWCSARCRS